MKKLLVILGFALGTQFINAQQSVVNELPIRLFNEGKNMFIDKNYVGCEHSLTEFKKKSNNANLKIEADYMLVASSFFRGDANAELKLKEFLDDNPETYHRNDLAFYIGTIHFGKKEWEKALFWFDQSDVNYLDLADQQDYTFRLAYTNLKLGNTSKAQHLLKLLNSNSDKYREASAFYLAYIDFRKGYYDTSLKTFEQLKNNPEYREEALFLLIRGYFRKGDESRTISEGENYIRTYPRSRNAKEVYRLLGYSYSLLFDVNQSIANYEKYMELEANPFPEDMYVLGKSYIQVGNYAKAIDVLKHAASTNDDLGQVAYMELGQAYLKTNDLPNALMSFDAASRVNFNKSISEAALYNYALLVHKTSLSVFDESITVFQRFLAKYPDSEYTSKINSLLAETLLSTKNYNAALNVITQIKDPGTEILQAKQVIYYNLASQYLVNSDYTNALRYFDLCIDMGNYDAKTRNESYFWKGEIAYRDGDYALAARNYQVYISSASVSDANYALALYNQGYAYFKLKDNVRALQSFQKYVAQERNHNAPTYADALNRIGDCYLYDRNFAASERFYTQAIAANSSSADYSEFQKAFVLGLQRNYGGKISALNDMMVKYPQSQYYDDALFEKSRALVMLNREQDAIAVLETLKQKFPDSNLNQQAGVQLGQLYFNTNNPQKSVEAYKRVISAYPNSEEARMAIKSLETVYKDMNDINAYASYVNSLGVGTVITASRQDSLSFLAAENIYMKGQKASSKEAMKGYLKAFPRGTFASDAHYFVGYMAFEDKDTDTALIEFNEVVSLGNRKYMDDALIYTSGIYFDKKQYQEAYDAYQRLSTVAATNENRHVGQLGMLRSASLLKRDKEVIDAATTLLADAKLSPEIATEARYYRAKSRLASKQAAESVKDLEVLIKDTRNSFGAESQYLLADMYYRQGAYDKAISQVQSFMKQGSPHEYWLAKSLIVLCDSYSAKGDDFQAKQYIESLKANYKGSEVDIITSIDERLNK